jgi:hypothetical protein
MLSYGEWIPDPKEDFKKIKTQRNLIKLHDSNPALDGCSYYYDTMDRNVYQWNDITKRFANYGNAFGIAKRLMEENKMNIQNEKEDIEIIKKQRKLIELNDYQKYLDRSSYYYDINDRNVYEWDYIVKKYKKCDQSSDLVKRLIRDNIQKIPK